MRTAGAFRRTIWLLLLSASVCGTLSSGLRTTVNLRVEVTAGAATKVSVLAKSKDSSNVVVWLTPRDFAPPPTVRPREERPRLVQRHKTFEPHLLVVPVGTAVDFPNRDPFFHNVFSVFDGKRFDLGLYESGATNSVLFDKPGVSFLFCNIHPEMSAVVVAVDTPYYAVSDHMGAVTIANVPEGSFELHVWYERSLPEELRRLTRIVEVSSSSADLGILVVPENADFTLAHKNKFGQDYPPPATDGYLPH
jgi:hypothetical protein